MAPEVAQLSKRACVRSCRLCAARVWRCRLLSAELGAKTPAAKLEQMK